MEALSYFKHFDFIFYSYRTLLFTFKVFLAVSLVLKTGLSAKSPFRQELAGSQVPWTGRSWPFLTGSDALQDETPKQAMTTNGLEMQGSATTVREGRTKPRAGMKKKRASTRQHSRVDDPVDPVLSPSDSAAVVESSYFSPDEENSEMVKQQDDLDLDKCTSYT